jgi:hypothetical protein
VRNNLRLFHLHFHVAGRLRFELPDRPLCTVCGLTNTVLFDVAPPRLQLAAPTGRLQQLGRWQLSLAGHSYTSARLQERKVRQCSFINAMTASICFS